VKRLLDGAVPGLPRFDFGVVDVRDVADLHLRAMTHEAARGERFLAVADFLSIREIAEVLKTPEVVQVLKNGGLDAEGTTPQQYAAQIKGDLARWAAVVKSAGVSGK